MKHFVSLQTVVLRRKTGALYLKSVPCCTSFLIPELFNISSSMPNNCVTRYRRLCSKQTKPDADDEWKEMKAVVGIVFHFVEIASFWVIIHKQIKANIIWDHGSLSKLVCRGKEIRQPSEHNYGYKTQHDVADYTVVFSSWRNSKNGRIAQWLASCSVIARSWVRVLTGTTCCGRWALHSKPSSCTHLSVGF